jgi:hypothetical protein
MPETPTVTETITAPETPTETCSNFPSTNIGLHHDAQAGCDIIYVKHPVPQVFVVGNEITISPGTGSEEVAVLKEIILNVDRPITPTSTCSPQFHVCTPTPPITETQTETFTETFTKTPTSTSLGYFGAFILESPLVKCHMVGEAIFAGNCCTECVGETGYKGFSYGQSFPKNVQRALTCGGIEMPQGATGPLGPQGPMGPMGPAAVGVPEASCDDTLTGNGNNFYVSPEAWYCASNRYAALVYTSTINNQTFTPDALEYNIFDITINGTCTLAAPVNFRNGRTISVLIRQGAGGNHTLNIVNDYKFDGGYDKITLTDDAKDVIVATNINDFVFCTIASDIKR